jgi:hypothetical protein
MRNPVRIAFENKGATTSIRVVIEVMHLSGAVSYFIGPSLSRKYNPRLLTPFLGYAKQYDSIGHAMSTAKKLTEIYPSVISRCRVIEVESFVVPTGRSVSEREFKVSYTQSKYELSGPLVNPQYSITHVTQDNKTEVK